MANRLYFEVSPVYYRELTKDPENIVDIKRRIVKLLTRIAANRSSFEITHKMVDRLFLEVLLYSL